MRDAIANIMTQDRSQRSEALAALVATQSAAAADRAAEVAHTVMWLCRPGSESITGQSIVLPAAR